MPLRKFVRNKRHETLQLSFDVNGMARVPEGNGLMLRLDNETGHLHVDSEEDCHFPKIHPNCFAPASLTDVVLLHGGGSGTAVFSGNHPELSTVVMKHAGPKDTEEVMSLAVVHEQLLKRGKDGDAKEAATFLARRIPQFLFCYISPRHVRDRAMELWNTLRTGTLRDLTAQLKNISRSPEQPLTNNHNRHQHHTHEDDSHDEDSSSNLGDRVFQAMKTKLMKRELWVCRLAPSHSSSYHGYGRKKEIEVKTRRFVLHVHHLFQRTDGNDCILDQGYDFLSSFTNTMAEEQEHRLWKCTLAQSRVGGPTSENGATVLLSGRLKGRFLERIIGDFIRVMQYLRQLSSPQEREGSIHVVREEVKHLEAQVQLSDRPAIDFVQAVSKACNEFAGTAIRKNYLPEKGRFPRLREYGKRFKSGHLVLMDDEKVPAMFLQQLLHTGCDMSDVFADPPSPSCVLDHVEKNCYWLRILQLATSFDSSHVNDCIWTCGLTDAGLHNTFVCKDRGLELFDLGAPQLMPMPAFLTKFLMSIFHALGMEEDSQRSDGVWVCRFEHNDTDNKLSLTRTTKSILPYIFQTFNYTMDEMIKVFDGNERVRELLLTYTTLQLVSDACFCLDRWDQKGGGRERVEDRNTQLGKWLWRSVWDLYITSHVYHNLLLPLQTSKT